MTNSFTQKESGNDKKKPRKYIVHLRSLHKDKQSYYLTINGRVTWEKLKPFLFAKVEKSPQFCKKLRGRHRNDAVL